MPMRILVDLKVTKIVRMALNVSCESEFVNVSGAQESILPVYVAWRASTIILFVVPIRSRARICKRLRSPRFDSEESIPSA